MSLGGVTAAQASPVASKSVTAYYSGHKVWCMWGWTGKRWYVTMTPPGAVGGTYHRTGECKIYDIFPLFLGRFEIVSPNGVKEIYDPS